MKNSLKLFMFIALVPFFISACGEKIEYTPVEGLETYTDNSTEFSIQYPKNWVKTELKGERIAVYSTSAGANRFNKYDSDGLPAARIDLKAVTLDSATTLDKVFEDSKIFAAETYSTPENITIDGTAARKLSYQFELQDGPFKGEMYIAAKDDGMATVLKFEAFANGFEEYSKTFGDILASVKLAVTPAPVSSVPDTVFEEVEAEPASATLKVFNGQGFSINIPENFDTERTGKKDVIYTTKFIGLRRGDCDIQVDVLDASEQSDLNKIVEDSRKLYGNAAPKASTIGGNTAKMLQYKPTSNHGRKVYFTVNDKKLYQITVTWFVPEQKDYLPIFDKCVQSFKFK